MRLLAVNGSLRRASLNGALVRAAAAALPPGAHLVELDGLGEVPPFSEDREEPPPAPVVALREAIAAADAVLVVTPEYNGSVPGQLKNALDWASRPFPDNAFKGKPVAVAGASTGMFGAIWAQADARRVLGLMGARVLDRDLAVPNAAERLDARGELSDPELAERLADLLAELAAEVEPVACAA